MTIQDQKGTETVFEKAEAGIMIQDEIRRLTEELDAIKEVVRAYATENTVDYKKVEIETPKGAVGVTFTRPKPGLAPKSDDKVRELEKLMEPAAFGSIFEEVTVTKTEIRIKEGYEDVLPFLSPIEKSQVEKLIKISERAPAVTFPKPPTT